MATRREIQRLTKLVRPLLLLQDWEIALVFREPIDHAADCTADPEYKQAKLRFDTRKITRADTLAFVVHELLHCHVERLAGLAVTLAAKDKAKLEWVRQEEELLTTTLEQIVVGLIHRAAGTVGQAGGSRS